MKLLEIFENRQLTLSRKRFIFYSLFLAYGIYLLWFVIPGFFNTIYYIANPPSLPAPQSFLMAGITTEHNYVEELIFTELPRLIAGMLLIITYFGYILSKKFARFTGIFGSIIYLIYPVYQYSQNWEYLSVSLGAVKSVLYYFLPAFMLIILTLIYWKRLEKYEEIKGKTTAITSSVKKLTFYSLFLTLGLITLTTVISIIISLVEVGLSFWSGSEQLIGIILYFIASSITMVLLLMTYYGFLYSKKYTRYTGIIGCIFFAIPFIVGIVFSNITILSLVYFIFYVVPPVLLAILLIFYWRKLS